MALTASHMRFTGQVTVEHISSQADHETVTSSALWELMFFGETMA